MAAIEPAVASTWSNVFPLSASGFVTVRLPQEQTLLLQRRSEGDRLAKLGEAQKHFSVLSRQCAAIKEAHQILEQSGENTLSSCPPTFLRLSRLKCRRTGKHAVQLSSSPPHTHFSCLTSSTWGSNSSPVWQKAAEELTFTPAALL